MSINNQILTKTKTNKSSGFTLIEVLVTVVILAIGLLGVANMQILGLTYNQNAYYRSQATQLADGIVEKMRMNPDGVAAGNYSGGTANEDAFALNFSLSGSGASSTTSEPPLSSDPDCVSNRCNSAQLATFDLINWQNDIMAALPKYENTGGNPLTTATITIYNGNRFTIRIIWGQKEEDSVHADKLLADNFVSRNVTLYIQL
ncbi:MAG: type IV pilus modification protein PilV [Pseudomonadota bacterium]